MRSRFGIIAAIVCCWVKPANAYSLPSGVTYTITPIVGFEKVVKTRPDVHTKIRLMYGALITGGYREISGEIEYTRASDNEAFPLLGLTTRDTDDRVKVGLRSTFSVLAPVVDLTARAGGQASRNIHEETLNGVTTKTIGKLRVDPYAGLSLGLNVATLATLSAGVTAVFQDFPDMSKTDYQLAFGLSLHL